MSAAAAAQPPAAAPKRAGKKKLIIAILAALLVLGLGGGGAAYFLMKKKAAEAAAEDGDDPAAAPAAHAKADVKHGPPPLFVPLDPFTVNLADRDAERYAQVGVTLEITDAKTADLLKAYMPAIRNNILLLLSHKTAAELLSRDGKIALAKEIRRESLAPLGIVVEPEEAEGQPEAADATRKKKITKAAPSYPVKAAHFSNLIIQ